MSYPYSILAAMPALTDLPWSMLLVLMAGAKDNCIALLGHLAKVPQFQGHLVLLLLHVWSQCLKPVKLKTRQSANNFI